MIGTNKKCAVDTIALLLEDREAGRMNEPTVDEDVESLLRDRVPELVTWDGWQAIDEHEKALGEPQGRPRVKLVDVEEMTSIAAQTTAS